ncbi:MAG: non-canonical purine NTP pyrophosphatase, partial [Clostridia bacterium]
MTELKSLFSPYITDKYELASLDDIGFDGDIDECADSFIENAFIKAETVAKKLNCITFADDSGLEVDALDGAPGVHSARYAGYHAADDTNLQKLLFEMRDINDGARNAQFVSAFVA